MKFRDTTDENQHAVALMKAQKLGDIIKIYSHYGTEILYTESAKTIHVSLSNKLRPVKENEVLHAVTHLVHTTPDKVDIFMTETQTIHIHLKKS
ncbi:MAG: hypothetical protein K0Q56_1503 [Sporolactobacillus laevolacticus]|nr:hypothetical protein [Sporolactobacillus laevolacticus]